MVKHDRSAAVKYLRPGETGSSLFSRSSFVAVEAATTTPFNSNEREG